MTFPLNNVQKYIAFFVQGGLLSGFFFVNLFDMWKFLGNFILVKKYKTFLNDAEGGGGKVGGKKRRSCLITLFEYLWFSIFQIKMNKIGLLHLKNFHF